MTDNFFDVDQSVSDRLNQGMQIGGSVEIPILAPFTFWKNGSAQNRPLKDANPILYYGGWGTDKQEMDDAIEAYGTPGKVIEVEMTNQDGKDYQAYVSRYVIVAPIAYRDAWFKKDGVNWLRKAKWEDGYNHHKIQMLCYRARQIEDGAEPWGPVVLTVSGYNAGFLLDAVKNWARFLDPVRKKYALNVPAWGFWMSVGSFGPEPIFKSVGKGTQKPINPIGLHFPTKEPTLEMLKKVFVGKDTLAEMAALMEECEEWLNNWKEDPTEQPAAASDYEEPPFEPTTDYSESPEDMPF